KIFVNEARVMPNGDLIVNYTGTGDTPYGYGMAKFDKNSKLIWTYDHNTHHNFDLKADGSLNILMQDWVKDPDKKFGKVPIPSLADYIVRLSPDGKETDRILILEAFRNSPFASVLDQPPMRAKWDFTHTNSVEELDAETAKAFPIFK